MSPAGKSFDARENRRSPAPAGAGAFGLKLFIASLGVLFAASLVGYLAVRLRATDWPPPGMPGLPWWGLLFSTIVLLASSGTIRQALRGARGDDQPALRRGLLATTVLGFVFLISQGVNWWILIKAHLNAATNLYGFTFFVLTGLHAAHVIGGLVVLVVVTRKAARGVYSAVFHPGVIYASLYWHFLDIVWIVMFLVIFLAT